MNDMNERLHVDLGTRGYDIVIGHQLLARAGEFIAPVLRARRVIVVTDEHVARFHLHRLTNALEDAGIRHAPVILPPGESAKSLEPFSQLMETLLEQKPDRDTTLVALGGGVVGDLTGFAASVLLRGVDFVQIPTTLLAQVDSSVGGKTGINSRFGKNLIGSFHQPRLVLIDVATLATLSRRELLAGYAETVKYGCINAPDFFAWLEQNAQAMLTGDTRLLAHAIRTGCASKAAMVEADEQEHGMRALLNLGHTFGHAFEAETGFGEALLHGEAVALGIVLAFDASVAMGLCPAGDARRVRDHLASVGLPVSPLTLRAHWDVDRLMEHFSRDKKAQGDALTFVLARGIGQAFVARNTDKSLIRQVLARTCEVV